MNIRACKGCIHFSKHYGNKNKKGDRVVSNYWCVAKNGAIKNFPKKCERKEDIIEVLRKEIEVASERDFKKFVDNFDEIVK